MGIRLKSEAVPATVSRFAIWESYYASSKPLSNTFGWEGSQERQARRPAKM